MKVYFQNSRGEERLFAIVKDEEIARHVIQKFLDEHNFKSYYIRNWVQNGRKYWDVGSHTEFFITEED